MYNHDFKCKFSVKRTCIFRSLEHFHFLEVPLNIDLLRYTEQTLSELKGRN